MKRFITFPVNPLLSDVAMSLPANFPHSNGTVEAEGEPHRYYMPLSVVGYEIFLLVTFIFWILLSIYTCYRRRHPLPPEVFDSRAYAEAYVAVRQHQLDSIVISDGAPSTSHGGPSLQCEGRETPMPKPFRAPPLITVVAEFHSPGDVELPQCDNARGKEPLFAAPSAKEKVLAEQARSRLYGKNDASATVANDSAPVLPSGPEPAPVDLVYYARHELAALEDDDSVTNSISNAFASLESTEWTEIVEGLNTVRQLGIHHSAVLKPRLHEAVPLVVQHVKSLRSSVCKTALLCVSDLTGDFGDSLLPLLDVGSAATSLLSQLLIKAASKDKKFVIVEAERCLNKVCATLDPTALYPMLIPFLNHKSQRIRASACECLAAVIVRVSDDKLFSVSAHGQNSVAELLEGVAPLVSDKMPEAREASRQTLLLLRAAFNRHNSTDDSQSWEGFVAAEIKTPADASAVLKVTAASLPASPSSSTASR